MSMLETLLAEGFQRVRCVGGAPRNDERTRIVQSGTVLERGNMLMEDLALIFATTLAGVKIGLTRCSSGTERGLRDHERDS